MNFGNKNSTCEYTTSDLLMGYGAASVSSVGMGLGLRKLTSGLTKGASGKKLFFLNFIVGASASGTANFFNTLCMRYVEISKGITVYKDEETTVPAGISKKAAESAVYETAISRCCMSLMCMGTPTILVLLLGAMGFSPKGRSARTLLDIGTITVGLYVGLPMSVAIFPPLSIKKGTDLEPEFHMHDKIYFNKGL